MAPKFLGNYSVVVVVVTTAILFAATHALPSSMWASQQDHAIGSSPSSSSAENHNQIVQQQQQHQQLKPPPRAHVPKYMLELYENMKKAQDKSEIADVVRSYSSVNGVYTRYDSDINEREKQLGSKTRIHTLIFNVSSLPEHEKLEKAELRLYALIRRDQHIYSGVERQVTISTCETTHLGGSECEVIESRHMHETASAWETFTITEAARGWLHNNLEHRRNRPEQRLEIQISSILTPDSGDLDFPTEPRSDTEPLLLLYSSDKRRPAMQITEDYDDNQTSNELHALRRRSADLMEEVEEESNNIFDADPVPSRVSQGRNGNNRRRHKNPCRRRSLYVDFADISYDAWIIAPTGYEAYECAGKCYFPLSDHLTPTKHAIVQTLLHTVSPKKTSRACCVPTRLSPISVLYVDDEGVVTYKFHYEDMVVAECGCR